MISKYGIYFIRSLGQDSLYFFPYAAIKVFNRLGLVSKSTESTEIIAILSWHILSLIYLMAEN